MVLGAIFLYLQKGPEEDFYSLNSSSFIPVLQNIEYREFIYSVSYTSTVVIVYDVWLKLEMR